MIHEAREISIPESMLHAPDVGPEIQNNEAVVVLPAVSKSAERPILSTSGPILFPNPWDNIQRNPNV